MSDEAHASSEAVETGTSARDLLRGVVELSKPSITRLVVLTTFLGVAAAPVPWRAGVLFGALAGTSLVVAGANALNMFLERETDAFMTRTRGRPLPSGRLTPEIALGFGVLVSMLGMILLAEYTTTLAVLLAALALLSYVLVYTPMKRIAPHALYIGAIPGAMPPAIGYAASTGSLDRIGISLFAILLVWQIPHFLAISIFRREEYARASLHVFPNVVGVERAKRLTFGWALALLAVTLVPFAFGVGSVLYAALALASGGAFAYFASRGFAAPDERKWAKRLFFSSMPHLVLVVSALVLTLS